jgi:pilus assembly protein CpaE
VTTTKVREILRREGNDCPPSNVVSLDQALEQLAGVDPELVVIVLSLNDEHGLTVVAGIRAQTQAPILAIGPISDSKLILQCLRAGATDYVDEAEIEADLRPVVCRILTASKTRSNPGRLIALMSPSGGSGSSTLAVNLATVLAQKHKSVLLLDLKRAAGDLADLLDLKPAHTLADLCRNSVRMDHVMFDGSLVRHASGVHLLAAPRSFADIPFVTPEGVRQSLSLGRSTFPYVLADLECSFREEEAEVLHQADLILLILRLDFASLRGTKHVLEYLRELRIDPSIVRLVVNRYGQPKEVPAANAEQALGLKIFHYVPEDAGTVNRANNNGNPLVLESPRAKIARSLTTLAHNINGQHKNP